MNQGLRAGRDDRLDAALRPRAVPRPDPGAQASRRSTSCRRSRWRSPSTRPSTSATSRRSRTSCRAPRRWAPSSSDKVAERLDCDVIQGYGMTETSPVTHIDPPRRREPRRARSAASSRHRVPDRRRRVRRGRGRGRARRALDPRPAGDGRLPQQRRGDRGRRSTTTAGSTPATSRCATRTASTSSSTGSRSSSSTRASRSRRPSSRRS